MNWPFKWGTENTFFAAANNRGYLFLESLLALSLTAAVTIFYFSIVMSLLAQVQAEKDNLELARALYDLSRLEETKDWQRQSNSYCISGRHDDKQVFVFESESGNSLEIIFSEID